MLGQHGIDRQRIEHDEFALGQVTLHEMAQPLRIGPGPAVTLFSVAKSDGHLIHYVLRAAVVHERQNRDPLGWLVQVVRRDRYFELAWVQLYQAIPPGLPSVGLRVIRLLEKRARLRILLSDIGASRQRGQDEQNYQPSAIHITHHLTLKVFEPFEI